jgi:cytoskeletal protein CcmA (bactofilin family)
MWKKDDMPTNAYSPEPERTPRPDLSVSSSAPNPAPVPTSSGAPGQRATIGRSITIRGDVTGDEDLLIQGRVDGSIDLKQHAVTIGAEGEVKASIVGRVVIVEGSVEGNISSEEQVVLRSSARVKGDITAPRLVLEDGARFRGGVDMGEDPDRGRSTGASAQAQPKRPGTSTPAPAATDGGKQGDSASDANGASKRKSGTETVAEATA